MECKFEGVVWEWRGPSPYHFVTVPSACADVVRQLASAVTCGWGMVPVGVRLGRSRWRTSLFPKDGGYVLPLRDLMRKNEEIALHDIVHVLYRSESWSDQRHLGVFVDQAVGLGQLPPRRLDYGFTRGCWRRCSPGARGTARLKRSVMGLVTHPILTAGPSTTRSDT
ncbi:DUF1905 domain-containing protein [Plantactinospora solaniradicis]|uniref:DUF1905 domain-containing protein n=1 Tax=Plantactinospora solaniradicis TaxID=1723736 RepID=A0ABW1KE84_9ACTN